MVGILNLDKPAGISSARAVGRVKQFLPRGTKIGHAGTLDPFATGVLLLLVGRATKCCESLMDEAKEYEATILLGSTTATDDLESPQTTWVNLDPTAPAPNLALIQYSIKRFVGQQMQQPPAYSAIHLNGRRAYSLARQGLPVVLAPRPVHVYFIEILDYAWPELKLRVGCGRGTYIRALARDIGSALNVGGHLIQLRRTRVGRFTSEDARKLADIDAANLEQWLVPAEL